MRYRSSTDNVRALSAFPDTYFSLGRQGLISVGSHVSFQLSSVEAPQTANTLDGGKALAERLKNLPKTHFIATIAHEPWQEAKVPTVTIPVVDAAGRFAIPRTVGASAE
jgi:hypothetical protein